MTKKSCLYIIAAALLLTACGKVEITSKKKSSKDKITAETVTQSTPDTGETVTAAPTVTAETETAAKKKKSKSKDKDKTDSVTKAQTTTRQTASAQPQSPAGSAAVTPRTEAETTVTTVTTVTTAAAAQPQSPAESSAVTHRTEAETTAATTAAVQTQAPAENVPAAPNTETQYEDPPAPPEISEEPASPGISTAKQISVNNISQFPELPTGCETTALTMLLNFYGVSADKVEIARNYLPKLDFYWQDGVMYGADYRNTFAGDPEDENSYGCYAPCIVTAANSCLAAYGSGYRANDISGQELDTLFENYIDNDIPVLIWITSGGLHEPEWTTTWTTPSGEQVQWHSWEHCVVLTGYDYDSSIVYVSDPMEGNTYYNMELLKLRYDQFGRQCVCIG